MIKLKKTQNNEEKKQTKTQKKVNEVYNATYSEQLENPFLNQVSNTKNTKNI